MRLIARDSSWRRLLEALADDAPAFRPRVYEPEGGALRRLLIALGDAAPAFSRHGLDDVYVAPHASRKAGQTASDEKAEQAISEEHKRRPVAAHERPAEPEVAIDRPSSPSKSSVDQIEREFADWYKSNVGNLFAYVNTFPGITASDASDIIQDTMITAYKSWPRIRQNPRIYIYRLAQDRAAKIRGQSRQSRRFEVLDPEKLPSDIAERFARWETPAADARVLAEQILSRLPIRERAVLSLTLTDRSTSDIAEELNITQAAVRRLLASARRRLAEILEQEDIL